MDTVLVTTATITISNIFFLSQGSSHNNIVTLQSDNIRDKKIIFSVLDHLKEHERTRTKNLDLGIYYGSPSFTFFSDFSSLLKCIKVFNKRFCKLNALVSEISKLLMLIMYLFVQGSLMSYSNLLCVLTIILCVLTIIICVLTIIIFVLTIIQGVSIKK